ncbi:MAG TPA: HAMP domain-containing protein, partial [Gammaproteobacteria bacterium]|nr:HAMP domain-containing protein [Gammaproteobacteria bacterium]
DKKLVDMASVLSTVQIEPSDNHPIVTDIGTTSAAFQIWHDRQLISRSNNSPEYPMTPLIAGFQDNNFGRYRWRNYVLGDPQTQHWVIVAERTDIRNRLIDNLIIESATPVIIVLPVALLTIWFLVGFGLRPLRQLARQLQQKQEHDLSPVSLTDPLKELQPLVNSTNNLLARLKNAFEREKRFSADAAHELRTPVSGLKINLYNLQTELPDNKNFKLLTAGVNRMEHVIEQILSLYRTTADQHMANFERLDLHEIAQYSIAQQYSGFEKKMQQIELSGTSTWLQCDRFSIEILLQNLLGNANKYTPESGNIKVSVNNIDDHIQLKIEDSGPGIPEDNYHRVFDRFYRMDGDQHDSGIEGCGLGLSIVQHIVQLHRGNIRLSRSKFPTGLAITIDFPTSDQGSEKGKS